MSDPILDCRSLPGIIHSPGLRSLPLLPFHSGLLYCVPVFAGARPFLPNRTPAFRYIQLRSNPMLPFASVSMHSKLFHSDTAFRFRVTRLNCAPLGCDPFRTFTAVTFPSIAVIASDPSTVKGQTFPGHYCLLNQPLLTQNIPRFPLFSGRYSHRPTENPAFSNRFKSCSADKISGLYRI